MAVPMTADEFLAALRTEGVHLIEHTGWRTHNREGHGAWGPVNGVMIHHTAGTAPTDGDLVWAGRSDLPGPLAHGYLAKDGTVTMTANGRANHAGGGDPAVLAAVMGESYGAAPPAPREHDGSGGAVDGNAHFYGLEISNRGDGKDPYPQVQYDAAVRWAAGICRHHGWSAKSVIGHKEWSDWKPDPSFDIRQFRADVAARLARPAGTAPTTTDPEDPMPLTDAEIDRIAKAAAKEVRWLPVDDPFKTGDAQTTLGGLWWESATRLAKLHTQSVAPVLSDGQLSVLADRIAASPALAEAVAARVDAKLAARLAQ